MAWEGEGGRGGNRVVVGVGNGERQKGEEGRGRLNGSRGVGAMRSKWCTPKQGMARGESRGAPRMTLSGLQASRGRGRTGV